MKRILLFFLSLAAMPAMMMAADDVLTISAAKKAARQWELTVQLTNPSSVYSGFQIDFQLPEGISLNTEAVASAVRTNSLTMQASVAPNGLPRVVGYASVRTNSILGTRGTIFTATLDLAEGLAAGDYELVAKNVRFTSTSGAETVLPNAAYTLTLEDKPEYKLTYWNGNDEYYTTMVQEGDPIPSVAEPAAKVGYTFCGWGEVPDVMPAEDLELRAVWCVNYYTLSFKVNNEVVHTEQVAYEAKLPDFNPGEIEGHTFCGWNDAPETMPANDLELTAKYCVNYYELKYVVYGEVVYTEQVAYGAPMPEFDPGEIEGYTFCGWNDAPETMPAEDLRLSAKYCVNYYELKFIVDGEVIYSEQVAYESPLPEVEAPVIDGYVFLGWEGEEHDEMPAKDLTYTARYAQVGDVNLDGRVNTADIVAIYNFISLGEDSDTDEELADINGDGQVNTADVTAVYNIINNGN